MGRLNRCPVCGGELVVRSLECTGCGTQINGRFPRSPFERLDEEQTEFLLEFLKSEGNFSDLARKLGVSFPTVKARFHALLKTLGLTPREDPSPDVKDVIDLLEKGQITVDEAERLLRKRR